MHSRESVFAIKRHDGEGHEEGGRADVAVLPIGGRRRFGMAQQMTPEQTADAAPLLKPVRAIPSRYGATSGSPFVSFPDDPLGEFRKAMDQKGLGDRVLVLELGESWHYAKP